MKNIHLLTWFLTISLIATSGLRGQGTTLSEGDLAVIGINTETEDFAFVAFVDLNEGTEIYFTDEEADGDYTISTNEGHKLYTAPSGGLVAGTVVTLQGNSSDFSNAGGSFALGNSGDGVIAYQGESVGNVTTFLHGIGEDGGDLGTFPDGFSNTLLIGKDDGQYDKGSRTGTASDLMTAINNVDNWTTTGSALGAFNTTSFTINESTTTLISFASGSASINEDAGTYDLTLSITNEDATTATECDVVLTTGSADDIDNYTTQHVTFAAGSAADETVTVTITDDTDYEGDETLTFSIQNVTGGNSAAAGATSDFDLTIYDNDPHPLPFTDAFDDADFSDKWIVSDFTIENSNNAGGTANEARLHYSAAVAGISQISTTLINTTGETQLLLSWDQKVDFYDDGDFTIKVQTTTDYVTFNDVYTQVVSVDEVGNKQVILDAADGVGSESLEIRWLYAASNGSPFTAWYIDNVSLTSYSVTPEPSNHVSSFAAAANGFDQIDLTWADNDGDNIAEGYLIKASTTSYAAITNPEDYTPESDDTDLSDGSGAINVAHGVQAYSWTGLSPESTYYFKIYPYTNAGIDIDYKTDGTIPTSQATTEAMPDPPSSDFITISEASDASSYQNEFLEIYNNSNQAVDFTNCKIIRYPGSGGAAEYVFDLSVDASDELIVQANGTMVISRGNDKTTFESEWGTLPTTATFVQGNTNCYFGNGRQWAVKYGGTPDTDDGTLIDETGQTVADGNRSYQFPKGTWVHEDESNSNPGVINNDENSATNGWTGPIDGDWSTGTNWGSGSAPTANDNVYIPNGTTITISGAKATADCYNLTLEPGGQLTNNGTLNVANNLTIEADATGAGSFINANTVSVTGETNVEQYLATNANTPIFNWHYTASPLASATADIFPGVDHDENGTTPNVYAVKWDEATEAWSNITTAVALTKGQGYAVPSAGDVTVTYNGGALTADDDVVVSLTHNGGSGNKEGFNLVGNPYTAALDVSTIIGTNWTQDIWIRQDGNFIAYNVAGGSGDFTHIPAMQGFWVRASAAGDVTMSRANLAHDAQTVYKENRIDMLQMEVSNGHLSDKATVYYNTNATNNFENYDTKKMFATDDNYPQIFTLANDKEVSINGIAPIEDQASIAVGFKTNNSGSFTLTFSNVGEFNPDYDVYLKDNQTNELVDLRKANTYEFYSDVTDNTSRFSIIITKSATDIETIANGMNIYSTNNTIIVKTAEAVHGVMSIYDISGKVILSQNVNINGTASFEMEQASGVYLVNINSANMNVTEKIVIR